MNQHVGVEACLQGHHTGEFTTLIESVAFTPNW